MRPQNFCSKLKNNAECGNIVKDESYGFQLQDSLAVGANKAMGKEKSTRESKRDHMIRSGKPFGRPRILTQPFKITWRHTQIFYCNVGTLVGRSAEVVNMLSRKADVVGLGYWKYHTFLECWHKDCKRRGYSDTAFKLCSVMGTITQI